MRNVEIKAKVKHLKQLIENAKKLSSGDGEIIKQHDTFYNVPQGRLKLRKFEDDSSVLIYYERPDTEGPKLSSYEKVELPKQSTSGLHAVLDKALGSKSIVKKVRHLYIVGQTRVHIDSVESLGDFMELEVVLRPEQSAEEGEIIAKDLMKSLGIGEEDLISGAYTDLLNKS